MVNEVQNSSRINNTVHEAKIAIKKECEKQTMLHEMNIKHKIEELRSRYSGIRIYSIQKKAMIYALFKVAATYDLLSDFWLI